MMNYIMGLHFYICLIFPYICGLKVDIQCVDINFLLLTLPMGIFLFCFFNRL